jgi:putative endonuclease
MSQQFFVYVLSNFKRNVLYIGVTNNLIKRVWQHKNDLIKGFTEKYQAHNLVYFELFEDPQNAIKREKQLKNWSRKKKDALITKNNPMLKDLYLTII